MKRFALAAGIAATVWCAPASAYAATGPGSEAVSLYAGVALLAAAVILLVVAFLLERVSRGSAIADNISYVVGAAICLGASALVHWVARLVPAGLPAEQAALSSDLLTLVAITLLSVYFLRVRNSLRRFLRIAEASEEDLARAQAGMGPDEPADARPAVAGTMAFEDDADG